MLNATNELLLSEYFLTKAILGDHLVDGKELFSKLSKIFLIPQEQVEGLYALAENDIAKSITTEAEYMRHQRLHKYSELIGEQKSDNAEWEKVAVIKGSAILIARNAKLIVGADTTRNVAHSTLITTSSYGMIIALRITGILQCEGIFMDKDVSQGLRNLAKSALWNDKVSALALLRYGVSRDVNMARLGYGDNALFKELYQSAVEKYGAPQNTDISVIKLINKAFNGGILKSEYYDPKYARILNSSAIHIKDKERAIFSQSAELVSVIGDLPLKLSAERIAPIDTSALQKTSIRREGEVKSIARALNNSDIRRLSSFRPICLCCDSRYVLDTYAKAIAVKNPDAHVEVIDVAELSECDFEPTRNNIFVRSVDEDKDNRFLLFFCGDISERKTDAVKSFLQSGRRAKFFLNAPGVTLDLSAVLPICFCDRKNAQTLERFCDIIKLSEIGAEELPRAIEDILSSKAKLYGVKKITLDGEVCDIFKGFDVDVAEKLVDQAVRENRENGAEIVLTRSMLLSYSTAENYVPRMGFGGIYDDRNK